MNYYCEHNPINQLQEYLLKFCPVDAINCVQNLQEFDIKTSSTGFKARVILKNTGKYNNEDIECPYSDIYEMKKDAKFSAAEKCLDQLKINKIYPHEQTKMNKVINVNQTSKGNHSQEFDNKLEYDLPDLSNLIDIRPVIKNPIPKETNKISNNDNLSKISDLDFDKIKISNDDDQSSDDDSFQVQPSNIGKLGEKFVIEWLKIQKWIEKNSLIQANEFTETASYDIQCMPKFEPGRKQIEVKTVWKGSKAKVSNAQRKRLFDPEDDYMLIVIGNFKNIFDPLERKSPDIAIYPNYFDKSKRQTGTVLFYNGTFGFIRPNYGDKNLYFNRQQLMKQYEKIFKGDKVEYIIKSNKGPLPVAKKIKIILF